MFREEAIARLVPDLQELARSIPEDRVQTLLPDLRDIREVLDARRAEADIYQKNPSLSPI